MKKGGGMSGIRKILLAFFILFAPSSVFADNLSMTTYYPAPSGKYTDLTSGALSVTTKLVFTTGGNSFFTGINGTSFYLNPGNAFGLTGLVISSAGNIGIKKAPTAALDVTGSGVFSGNLNAVNVTASGMFLHSDERLKEDIVPISAAFEKVKALNGVYFKYKGRDGKRVGLIAQNVEKVFPEVIGTDSDGMKTVDYSSLVAVLIEAVKEQQAMINTLQADIDKLKAVAQ